MKDLSLILSSEGSVASIKDNRFYIIKKWDDAGMYETDLEGFKAQLELYRNVCTNTWNQKLKDKYQEICSEAGMQ